MVLAYSSLFTIFYVVCSNAVVLIFFKADGSQVSSSFFLEGWKEET